VSKINELLKTFTTNGIKFHKLGELEDLKIVKLGRGDVISKMDMSANPGSFPVYSSSATSNGLFGTYGKFMFEDERITWSIDGGGKFFYREPHKYSVTNVCGWLTVLDKDKINIRYLYFVLIAAWGGRKYNYTVKAHPSVIREDYVIPLPPLEVQVEIVRILDSFTDLVAELEAELEARKSQFSYFLDHTFDNEEIRVFGSSKLADHGEFDRGNGLQKTDFSEDGVGCIHYGQIYTKFGSHAKEIYSHVPEKLAARLKKVSTGNLVVTTTSENIKDVCKAVAWMGESEIVIGGHSCVYRHDLDPLFATYLFRSRIFQDQKNSYVQGTKVKDIKPIQIGQIEVFVPPKKQQVAIGKMLRDFDALISDVEAGLPAEINARLDQYEYYRSKLLGFKELELA
jgi:type I restriction enzyme S subunit